MQNASSSRVFALAIIAGLLVALVPTGAGHAAPLPAAYETRILHDHNDDSAVMLQGKHGFDAIALDAREGYNANIGDYLVLRLTLNGGCKPSEPSVPSPDPNDPFSIFGGLGFDPIAAQSPCGVLTMEIEFETPNGTALVTMATKDGGMTWNGTPAAIVGPFDLNDGSRFAIEAWVPFAELGIADGDDLGTFFVRGYWGDQETDHMPAGVDNSRGTEDATGPIATAYDLGTYPVRAPTYFFHLVQADDAIALAFSAELQSADVVLQASNPWATAQELYFTTSAPEGVEVLIDGSSSSTIALDANGTVDATISVDASRVHQSLDGIVTVDVVSSLGGRAQWNLPVGVSVPAPTGMVLSGPLAPGASFTYLFEEAGTFSYHNHERMKATATVMIHDMTGETPTVHNVAYTGGPDYMFDPSEMEIHVGDTVTWTNDSDETLAVMGAVGAGHDHDDHDHEDSPGIGAIACLLALVAMAGLLARRR